MNRPDPCPLIWCAISGHGYGHAAQVVPVLNELSRRVPGLKAVVRTSVPDEFFRDRLRLEWERSEAEQDIGCVQRGPLQTDVPATWDAYRHFHRDWSRRIDAEVRAIRQARPRLVLSNISHLATAAASQVPVPAVALSNLSWDLVLEVFQDPADSTHRRILEEIRAAYGHADMMLRLTPGLDMPAFRKVVPIGPVRQDVRADRVRLIRALDVPQDTTVVLIGFGGVPLEGLPFEVAERMHGYHFVHSGPVSPRYRHVTPYQQLGIPFPSILASVDAVMTKPGYSTIVEAVAHSKPVLYVRRHNFADEHRVVEYLHRFGRGLEIHEDAFRTGAWEEPLAALLSSPPPAERDTSPNGAVTAAALLDDQYF